MGTGINLTRARNCIIFELDWVTKHQVQGFGRVHRMGQKSTPTNLVLLYNTGNPAEKSIYARQEARGKATTLVWEVTTGAAEIEEKKRRGWEKERIRYAEAQKRREEMACEA